MAAFADSRAESIHVARVYLTQARQFRLRGCSFAFTLIEWAGMARRRAMLNPPEQVKRNRPIQADLFGHG